MRISLFLLALAGSASGFLTPVSPKLGLRAAPASASSQLRARSPLLPGAPVVLRQTGRSAMRGGLQLQMKKDITKEKPENVKVLVAGSTGYIGRFVTKEVIKRGYNVVAFSREKSGVGGKKSMEDVKRDFEGAECVFGDVTSIDSLRQVKDVDVVISCLASRTGGIQDSWDIDYQASKNCLDLLVEQGGSQYVLLSAICVQKPLLEFQRAKLQLEEAITSQTAVDHSIIRPTAFFKSLAGQVSIVKGGNPYVMFGDGEICKANAISEADLAIVMADTLVKPEMKNKILPVGGPGEPVTPLQQSKILFDLFGLEPKYIKVPIGVFDAIIGTIEFFSKFFPSLVDTAEFAKIGRYYATEDMVGPSYGTTTLKDFFEDVAKNGLQGQELGDQAVFNIKGE